MTFEFFESYSNQIKLLASKSLEGTAWGNSRWVICPKTLHHVIFHMFCFVV